MKILQTFWSKPIKDKNGLIHSRSNGGWPTFKNYLNSICFSCLKLKQHYNNVELVTDIAGKELLIDKLELPYSKVHVCLDQFNDLPSLLWAVPKVYAYSIPQERFLHADNDVYIWKRFPKRIEEAELIAQNLEVDFPFYYDSLEFINKNCTVLPAVFDKYTVDFKKISSINAGIIGGSDIDFINTYVQAFLKFIYDNKKLWDNENAGNLNFFEQYLFYTLAIENKKNISFLVNSVNADYSEVLEFNKVPRYSKFIHAVGFAKSNQYVNELIDQHLRYEFPETYNTISNLLKSDFILNSEKNIENKNNSNTININEVFEKNELCKKIARTKLLYEATNVSAALETEGYKQITSFEANIKNFLNNCTPTDQVEQRYQLFENAYSVVENNSYTELLKRRFLIAENNQVIITSIDIELLMKATNIDAISDPAKEPVEYLYLLKLGLRNNLEIIKLDGLNQLLYYFNESSLSGNELVKSLSEEYSHLKQSLKQLEKKIYGFLTEALLYDKTLKLE